MKSPQQLSSMPAAMEIASLNNNGADLLENGESAGAITVFTEALRMAKSTMHIDRNNDDTRMESESADYSYSLDQVIEPNHIAAAEDEERDTNHGNMFFRRAFRIKKDLTLIWQRLSEPEGIQMMSTIAISNLAFAFHSLAISNQHSGENITLKVLTTKQEQELKKAVKLYECAFELQKSEDWECSSFVVMAILTNLSHAHALLGNMQVSDDCSRQLLSTLMFLLQTESHTRMVPQSMEEEQESEPKPFDFFLGSIMHLVFRTRASQTAPAA